MRRLFRVSPSPLDAVQNGPPTETGTTQPTLRCGQRSGCSVTAPPPKPVNAEMTMQRIEDRTDGCPHCGALLEIVCVKFGFIGTKMVSSCPNCAMAFAEASRAESHGASHQEGTPSQNSADSWECIKRVNVRAKYAVVLFVAAVITAGILRHIIHVYGGLPREEIRLVSILLAMLVIAALPILFRRLRGRPSADEWDQ
jgi:anaerobic C4-dicarboxylate transporter